MSDDNPFLDDRDRQASLFGDTDATRTMDRSGETVTGSDSFVDDRDSGGMDPGEQAGLFEETEEMEGQAALGGGTATQTNDGFFGGGNGGGSESEMQFDATPAVQLFDRGTNGGGLSIGPRGTAEIDPGVGGFGEADTNNTTTRLRDDKGREVTITRRKSGANRRRKSFGVSMQTEKGRSLGSETVSERVSFGSYADQGVEEAADEVESIIAQMGASRFAMDASEQQMQFDATPAVQLFDRGTSGGDSSRPPAGDVLDSGPGPTAEMVGTGLAPGDTRIARGAERGSRRRQTGNRPDDLAAQLAAQRAAPTLTRPSAEPAVQLSDVRETESSAGDSSAPGEFVGRTEQGTEERIDVRQAGGQFYPQRVERDPQTGEMLDQETLDTGARSRETALETARREFAEQTESGDGGSRAAFNPIGQPSAEPAVLLADPADLGGNGGSGGSREQSGMMGSDTTTETLEFERRELANAVRDDLPADALAETDDRRRTTVQVDASALSDRQLNRLAGQAADAGSFEDDKAGQVPLTEAERSRIDFTETTVPEARAAKGVFAAEGVDDFVSFYDETLTVDENRDIASRASRDEQGKQMDAGDTTRQRAARAFRSAEQNRLGNIVTGAKRGSDDAVDALVEEVGSDEDAVNVLMAEGGVSESKARNIVGLADTPAQRDALVETNLIRLRSSGRFNSDPTVDAPAAPGQRAPANGRFVGDPDNIIRPADPADPIMRDPQTGQYTVTDR